MEGEGDEVGHPQQVIEGAGHEAELKRRARRRWLARPQGHQPRVSRQRRGGRDATRQDSGPRGGPEGGVRRIAVREWPGRVGCRHRRARNAAVVADVDSAVIRVPRQLFQQYFVERPENAGRIRRAMERRAMVSGPRTTTKRGHSLQVCCSRRGRTARIHEGPAACVSSTTRFFSVGLGGGVILTGAQMHRGGARCSEQSNGRR